jgi:FtsP/CotA-like multicopper oxidase with cupredoxin domain
MRAIEFDATEPGDWGFHCHKSHHTMNAMGHKVPTMIGVDHRGIAEKISKLVPDYMVMGDRGMGDMADMEMPLPDNTLPMMTGDGPFGSVEMGGMFTVLQVRADQKPGDYSNPGWYKHPPGTIAYEWKGEAPESATQDTAGGQSMPAQVKPADTKPVETMPRSRKASGHEGH